MKSVTLQPQKWVVKRIATITEEQANTTTGIDSRHGFFEVQEEVIAHFAHIFLDQPDGQRIIFYRFASDGTATVIRAINRIVDMRTEQL